MYSIILLIIQRYDSGCYSVLSNNLQVGPHIAKYQHFQGVLLLLQRECLYQHL